MRRRRPNGRDVTRLAVCASHERVRERIEGTLVRAGHEVVAVTESVDELSDNWTQIDARLVVLACEVEPFVPLLEVAKLRSGIGDVPIVVVATGFLTSAARRLVRADVQGVLHETDLEATLLPTLDSVLADQVCVPVALRDVLAQPVFSHREKQVLELVLDGLTNAEIASRLYLSESTVKSHLASSFRKLGVSSRFEAAKRMLGRDSGADQPLAGVPDGPTLAATPQLT